MRKRRIIADYKDFYLDERIPSFLDLLPSDLKEKTPHDLFRWFIQFPYGYKVYTLRKKGDGSSDEEIAYCFISKSGNFRYPFAKKNEVIVGPYYVTPKYRGNHFASKMIALCLNCYPGQTAWDFIQHTNIASICSSERAGFSYFSDAKFSKRLRILQPCSANVMGDTKLFRKKGEQK